MGWKQQEVLDRYAASRLREVLKRELTSKEIVQQRHGEQALKLEHPSLVDAKHLQSLVNAKRVQGRAGVLTETSKQLVTEISAKCKKSRRLLRAAAKMRRAAR